MVKKQLYVIPGPEQIDLSLALAQEYGAAFEYNDFFLPHQVDTKEKLEERIAFYEKLDRDRSRDMLHGAFLDVTVHSSDPYIFRVSDMRIRQSMDIADRLGVRGVVFHTNFIANFRSESYRKDWLERNGRFWKEMLKEYPHRHIYMENMFDEEPDLLAMLAERLKAEERFGVCFDYAHAALSHTPLSLWVKKLAPYVKHMHLNDNDLYADLHGEIGSGAINWKEFTELMKKYKIETSVLVEMGSPVKQEKSLSYMKQHSVFPFG